MINSKIIIDTEKNMMQKYQNMGLIINYGQTTRHLFKEKRHHFFYTTSNLPFCKSAIIRLLSKNSLTINYGDECNEPPKQHQNVISKIFILF